MVEERASYLRTDLDAFSEIEMAVLRWMGEVRMDAALKALYPEQIPADKRNKVPVFPYEDLKGVENVLKKGEKRVFW